MSEKNIPLVQSFETNSEDESGYNMTMEEIWDFAGNAGVYSESPKHFASVFDVLLHHHGVLFYRMKTEEEIKNLPEITSVKGDVRATLMVGIRFEDPMSGFLTRDDGEGVNIMCTHDTDGTLFDGLETNDEIPLEDFKNHLNTQESFFKFAHESSVIDKEEDEEDEEEEEEEDDKSSSSSSDEEVKVKRVKHNDDK